MKVVTFQFRPALTIRYGGQVHARGPSGGVRKSMDRRTILRKGAGLGVVATLSGCGGLVDGGDDVQDTDGDGVIDSQDYAPRDPDVQEESDVTGSSGGSSTPEPNTPSTPSPSIDVSAIQAIERNRNQISADVQLGGASRVEFVHDGQTIGTFEESRHKVFHEINDSPVVQDGETVTVYGYWGGEKHEVAEKTIVGI